MLAASASCIEAGESGAGAAGGGIDLWLSFHDDIHDPALLDRLQSLLNEQERRQEARFVFAADRKRYRVTRALVRTVLSRYAPIEPAAWDFAANAYGRPAIANRHAALCDLDFNVSHSQGLIVMGVTRNCALGVDVEHVSARAVSPSLARYCFAPQEVAALASVPPAQFQDRFFQYWTFKEAYIKARGMGLSIPLDQFSFDYPCDRTVTMSALPGLDASARSWRFWQYRPAPDYVLAVCADRAAAQIRLRRVVPTLVDEALPLTATRTSGC